MSLCHRHFTYPPNQDHLSYTSVSQTDAERWKRLVHAVAGGAYKKGDTADIRGQEEKAISPEKRKALWPQLSLAKQGPTLHLVYVQLSYQWTSRRCPTVPVHSQQTWPVFLSCCYTEQWLLSPWQLLSDGTGAESRDGYKGCITPCCWSMNCWELPSNYPLSRLKMCSRRANLLQLPLPALLLSWSVQRGSTAQLCPCCAHGGSWGTIPPAGGIMHCSFCGYTKGFTFTVKKLSFSMISLLPLCFQYPVSQEEFLCAWCIFIVGFLFFCLFAISEQALVVY